MAKAAKSKGKKVKGKVTGGVQKSKVTPYSKYGSGRNTNTNEAAHDYRTWTMQDIASSRSSLTGSMSSSFSPGGSGSGSSGGKKPVKKSLKNKQRR